MQAPDQKLPLRQLGSTNLKLSVLGLGTVKFGRNEGVKYPNAFNLPSEESLADLLFLARDLGINYIDTAPAYGESEARLGRLLAKHSDDFVVSTKVGEYFANGESHYDFTEETTIASVEKSLLRLGRDQLDIVFVHSNGDDDNIIQHTPVLEALQRLKEKGDIGAIGFSGKDAAASSLAIPLVDIFMVALNEDDQSQASLLMLCQQNNKGVVIKKALASGHAKNPDQALIFAATYAGVTSVIAGTISADHLKRNAAVLAGI